MSSDSGATPGTRGRRDRPAKPALTRPAIIGAALEILSNEGLAKVTMRRIAGLLDTGHASLYVYVRDTEDLHAQILDALLEPVVAKAEGDWRQRLKSLLFSYGEVLRQYPEMARMALSTRPNGPNFTAVVEQVLTLLVEGGANDRAAAWGVDVLLLMPTAMAVEHGVDVTPRREAARVADSSDQIKNIDPQRYPTIARLGMELVSGAGSERADWALDVLLDGILAHNVSAEGGSA